MTHSHRGEDSFSPQDVWMVAEQSQRPDRRPIIPISIVVGSEKFYILVCPKDSFVKDTPLIRRSLTGVMESFQLGDKLRSIDDEVERNRIIDEYIQQVCMDKRLALYEGDLKEGIASRISWGIGKKLADGGLTDCKILRPEFNPNIPDPDLQIAAIMVLEGANPNIDADSIALLVGDFISFMSNVPGCGELKKDGSFIMKNNGTPAGLARVEILGGNIRITFPRTTFYGDMQLANTQKVMISNLEMYFNKRLSDRLTLSQ